MKKLSRLCLATLFALSITSAIAQDYTPPANVKLEKREDYAPYEPEVIKAANWLETTPLQKDNENRVNVNQFVTQWITGSPTVSVTLSAPMLSFTKKNPDLLIMFMAGYTRWVLENNHLNDELPASVAAVKSVIHLYKLGGAIKKDKSVEQLITAEKEGKLEEWVKERLPKK